MTTPRDDIDARMDAVLETATRPRSDSAFRARVVDALDRTSPAPMHAWRLPGLAAAGVVLTAIVIAWAWWPNGSRPVRVPEEARIAESPAATPHDAKTPGVIVEQRPVESLRGERGLPARRGRHTGTTAVAAASPVEDDGGRIPRIVVTGVAVTAITVEPLASAPELAPLSSPEDVEIEPLVVQPLDGMNDGDR
jgi:hypothetical protein